MLANVLLQLGFFKRKKHEEEKDDYVEENPRTEESTKL